MPDPAAHGVCGLRSGTIGFRGVPEEVWNFHIGGYQVCEKWLKDRKGRTLSKDDIAHYQKIVVALAETIRLMREIDEVIDRHGGWPAAFAAEPASKAPASSPAPTAVAPPRPVAPGKAVDDEERKSILAALEKAGEPLGTPLLSFKSKIDRRRLDEILPILVHQGIVKQSGTGGSARYSWGLTGRNPESRL